MKNRERQNGILSQCKCIRRVEDLRQDTICAKKKEREQKMKSGDQPRVH